MSLNGKVVIITGPAAGIGAATARLFARRGTRSHSSLGSLNSTFDYIFTYLGTRLYIISHELGLFCER